MDSYPCQRDLSPLELLDFAHACFDDGDYGAAIFYSTFVLGIPEYDGEANTLVCLAEVLQRDARRAMDEDLVARLEGRRIRVTHNNHAILMQEWSPHWDRYICLLNEFGADY